MADEELLRSIRIVEPDANKKIDSESTTSSMNYKTRIRNSDWTARLDVCQKGRRKYAVLRSPNTYFPDINDDYKFEKVDRSMSDDEIIKNALFLLQRQADNNGYRNFEIFSSGDDLSKNQMVLQDPWKDSAPTLRHYGFTYYYLNDGSQVHIEWLEGSYVKGSNYDDANGFIDKLVTYFPYSKNFGTDRLSPEFKDQSDTSTRNTVKYQKKDGTFDWADKVEYSDRLRHYGLTEDSNIIASVISNIQSQISRFNGVDSKLALCNPDTESCKLIRHVDFNAVTPPTTTDDSATKDLAPGLSQSSDKTKLFLVGLPDDIQIKAGENLPDFSVYVNKIPDVVDTQLTNPQTDEFSDLEELDGEYVEAAFSGEGEGIVTLEEFKEEMAAAEEDAKNAGDAVPIGDTVPIGDVKGVPTNTTTPATSVIPPAFNSTPIYSQYDPRWANSPFDWAPNGKKCGDKSTVSTSGCGPSAVSMVINFWASKGHCKPVTPAIVAKFFADFGGRVCGSGSGLGGVPKAKFKETFGIVLNYGATDAQIMSALKKGYPCVIAGRGYTGYNFKGVKLTNKYTGGHFVCLTGIDSEGRIRVNDSGANPSGGKGITAFLPGKTPGDSTSISQRAILYPASMSSPV